MARKHGPPPPGATFHHLAKGALTAERLMPCTREQVAINRQRVAGVLQRAVEDLPAQQERTARRRELEADIRTYLQVGACVCVCVCMCLLVQTSAPTSRLVCACACACVRVRVWSAYVRVCALCACVCVCVYACLRACVCVLCVCVVFLCVRAFCVCLLVCARGCTRMFSLHQNPTHATPLPPTHPPPAAQG